MSMNFFRRIEKKYLIDTERYILLMSRIGEKIQEDKYSGVNVRSTYLDTPSFLIIRNSIDADVYKEKLRIRSYGDTEASSTAFIELKKKYMGVVYKRREALPFESIMAYVGGGPLPLDTQIMREIDYSIKLYGMPQPKMFISYDREAYVCGDEPTLRITFDTNVMYRTEKPLAIYGTEGVGILDKNKILMEIKTAGAVPLWLSRVLSEQKIYPSKYSKYGAAYKDYLQKRSTK